MKSNFNLSLSLLAAMAAFLLYANTIGHGYVLDDAGVITGNAYVQQGLLGIPQILTTEMWHFENVKLGYYRPLSLITFAAEHQFFPCNAVVSHLVNVLLYALTAFFLCLLLMQIFKTLNPLFSFLVTLLFLAHPLHTEVVANIKSRDEILSFLNLTIAAFFLLKAVSAAKSDYLKLALSGLFFYLALLSKESAVTGILLFPLFLYFSTSFSARKILTAIAPFVAIILLFQFQKFLALGSLGDMNGSDIVNYPYAESGAATASAFLIFAWCIKMILLPHPLLYSYAYSQIPAAEYSSSGFVIGLLIVALLLWVVYKELPKKSPLAIGLLVFGITLAPAMGFVLLRGGIFAERFLYAPALGFSIVVVWLLAKVSKFSFQTKTFDFSLLSKNVQMSAALVLLLGLYSFKTIARNAEWKDEFTLVSADVQKAENNCQVQLHYGTVLVENGYHLTDAQQKNDYFRQAIEHLNRAIQINPKLPDAYFQLGQAYRKLAVNFDSAVVYYNKAMLVNTQYANSYLGLATLYDAAGKQELASYYYNKTVQINPSYMEAVALRQKHVTRTGMNVKEFPASQTADTAALNQPGKDFSYYNEQGKAYGQQGDFINAVKFFDKALELQPNSEEALINLSVCLGMTKNYERCIVVLNQVLELNPNDETALTNLAIIYRHVGNTAKAQECQQKLQQLHGQ